MALKHYRPKGIKHILCKKYQTYKSLKRYTVNQDKYKQLKAGEPNNHTQGKHMSQKERKCINQNKMHMET